MTMIRLILLLMTTLYLTSACTKKIQKQVGVVTIGPNEYDVVPNKPLEVPPHYDLPPIKK
jgi:hypothetical protein